MTTVAVVGLGYVGLPLAVEFGKKHEVLLAQALGYGKNRRLPPLCGPYR